MPHLRGSYSVGGYHRSLWSDLQVFISELTAVRLSVRARAAGVRLCLLYFLGESESKNEGMFGAFFFMFGMAGDRGGELSAVSDGQRAVSCDPKLSQTASKRRYSSLGPQRATLMNSGWPHEENPVPNFMRRKLPESVVSGQYWVSTSPATCVYPSRSSSSILVSIIHRVSVALTVTVTVTNCTLPARL
jgi:hypothetical protein